MSFLPCPHCRRHVATTATQCPFCEAAIEVVDSSSEPARRRRLGRVAAFTVQAAVATTALGACDGVVEDEGTGGSTTGGQTSDDGASGGAATGGYPAEGGAGGEGGSECDWDACAIYSAIPTP